MKIGVLALQGAFIEHIKILQQIGVEAVEVRLPQQLDDLNGLIIPGGESTTIGKLATDFHLIEPLRQFGQQRAIWGTCAGAIFLSKDAHRRQPLLKLMDITVERNAFGRQIASFEMDLDAPIFPDRRPYHAIFIRAPLIASVSGTTEVLVRLPAGEMTLAAPAVSRIAASTRAAAQPSSANPQAAQGWIVAARQGRLLVTSFHPELTGDDRFHRFFMELAK